MKASILLFLGCLICAFIGGWFYEMWPYCGVVGVAVTMGLLFFSILIDRRHLFRRSSTWVGVVGIALLTPGVPLSLAAISTQFSKVKIIPGVPNGSVQWTDIPALLLLSGGWAIALVYWTLKQGMNARIARKGVIVAALVLQVSLPWPCRYVADRNKLPEVVELGLYVQEKEGSARLAALYGAPTWQGVVSPGADGRIILPNAMWLHQPQSTMPAHDVRAYMYERSLLGIPRELFLVAYDLDSKSVCAATHLSIHGGVSKALFPGRINSQVMPRARSRDML